MYRHEARWIIFFKFEWQHYFSFYPRDIVRNAVNASEHDAVIFTGSGCTGAVHKLIHALKIEQSPVRIG